MSAGAGVGACVCSWCGHALFSRSERGAGLCKACYRRSLRQSCRFCLAHYRVPDQQAATAAAASSGGGSGGGSGRHVGVCTTCFALAKTHGAPHRCRFCALKAAFGSSSTCERCSAMFASLGSPHLCVQCGRQAAFARTAKQLLKTNGTLMCFLCTRDFKRRAYEQARKVRKRARAGGDSTHTRGAAGSTARRRHMHMHTSAEAKAEAEVLTDTLSTATTERATLQLLDLNDDVLLLCCSFLDAAELLVLMSRCCRRLRRLLAGDSRCWATASSVDFGVVNKAVVWTLSDELIQLTSLLCSNADVPNHALDVLRLASVSNLVIPSVVASLGAFRALHTVDLSGALFDDASLLRASRCFASVCDLRLANLRHRPLSERTLVSILSHCARLRLLDIEGWSVGDLAVSSVSAGLVSRLGLLDLSCNDVTTVGLNSAPNLLSASLLYLDLSECALIGASVSQSITSSAPSLVYLNLRRCPLSRSHVLAIFAACVHLLELDISFSFVPSSAFEPMATATPPLQTLHLHSCQRLIDRRTPFLIVERFPNLRHLDLSSCLQFDDVAIASMLESSGSKRLQSLNLGSLVKLSSRCVVELVRRLPSLRELMCGGCWYVEERVLEPVLELRPHIRMRRHDTSRDRLRQKRLDRFQFLVVDQ